MANPAHAPEDTHPEYQQVLDAIKADPQAVIREQRMEQLMSFKLLLPEQILAVKKNRRYHYEQWETAKAEVDKRRDEITLAVKDEIDPTTNKPKYRNKEKRDVIIAERLEKDATFNRYDKLRRRMYAQAKQLEDEIDCLVRYDDSMIEILAMMTAMVDFQIRFGSSFRELSVKGRSASRSSRRAREHAQPDQDHLSVAGN